MKLQVPNGCGSLGYGGQVYEPVKGIVEVPNDATIFLEEGWGCTLISEPEEAAEAVAAEKKGK